MGDHRHYFRCTPWYHWLWALGGIALLTLLIVSPEALPYNSLGPVGSFLSYLAHQQQNLLKLSLLVTVIVHFGEGYYASLLARRMNLAAGDTVLWTVQTTLLGFTSLLPLKAKYNQVMKEAKD